MQSSLIMMSFGVTFAAFFALAWLFRRSSVHVYPFQSNLVLRFGKCVEEITEAGLHFRPNLLIPGYRTIKVSRQTDFETLTDLHVNDRDGTTLRIDLWLEYRVVDARKSVFAVENWKEAMRNSLIHTLTDAIASRTLDAVIRDREAVTAEMAELIRQDAEVWGVQVEQIWIQDVRILPEIAKQFFDRVAAQIEMEKARVEEEGRIAVQMIQAETESEVAVLQAQARSMHPLAVGRAYGTLGKKQRVANAYEELYRLSLLQPSRTVTFMGFKPGEVRALDAVMIPEIEDKSAPELRTAR